MTYNNNPAILNYIPSKVKKTYTFSIFTAVIGFSMTVISLLLP